MLIKKDIFYKKFFLIVAYIDANSSIWFIEHIEDYRKVKMTQR